MGGAVERRRGDAPAAQLPHRRRAYAGEADGRELGDGVVLGLRAPPDGRAALDDDVLGSARAAPGPSSRARRVRDRLDTVLPRPAGPGRGKARRARPGLSTPREAERALPAPGLGDVRRGATR